MRNIVKKWIPVAVLCVGLATTLSAQVSTATITGSVLDATGAVIPGATVDLHNVDTGLDRSATSNGQGLYIFDYVPVGPYTVTATSQGFASTQNRVVLVAG